MTEQKETTKTKVLQLKKEHPEWSSEKIGAAIGVSKQAVHRISKDLGISTRMQRVKIVLLCKYCKNTIDNSVSRSKVYCSNNCRDLDNKVFLKCDNCQKELTYSKSTLNRLLSKNWRHVYCSRPCYYEGKKRFNRDSVLKSSIDLLFMHDVV